MNLRYAAFTVAFTALAAPALADCQPLAVTDLVAQSLALSPETDDAQLLELILRDTDHVEPDLAATPREAIVVTEQILRGGSASALQIEVYAGQEAAFPALCDTPVRAELFADLAQPYRIDTFLTENPGQPGLEIRYRFWGDNAFGDYQTDSAYVTDERVERYLPADGSYVLESREILDCILCAPSTKPD